jgi:chromate transporter
VALEAGPLTPASLASPLGAGELLGLFGHFLVLSLISIGGAITTASDMHRYVVQEKGWMGDDAFTASIAIAQAAPGPNILFVAVIGWNIAGPLGALATLAGILIPSTTLTLWVARFARQRRETRGVRAFVTGLAPVTIGLLLATGWVLAQPYLAAPDRRLGASLLMAVTVLAIVRTRIGPMWLVALGAVVGALGWV